MKITLESTTSIVEVVVPGGTVRGRIWEGMTSSGLSVVALITRIATPVESDQREFARELEACAPPSPMAGAAFPTRLVL